jgi:hypothetical protein
MGVSMAEVGIVDTKELLVGVNELTLEIIKQTKDGLQVGKDLAAIFVRWQEDPVFQEKLTVAVKGISNVSAEIKDLSVQEGIELASIQLQYIPEIFKLISKE